MVRTTSTGGVKMIYDGEVVDGKCANTGDKSTIGESVFNNEDYGDDNAYVGYMYGLTGLTEELSSPKCVKLSSTGTSAEVGSETDEVSCNAAGGKWVTTAYEATHANVVDSTIKIIIDNWFANSNLNIEENLSKIEDAVYCDDRSIYEFSKNEYTNLGYGKNITGYKVYSLLLDGTKPTLECTNKKDKFTISSEKGNGSLTYPVGLITADEVVLAGAAGKLGGSNSDYYLNIKKDYWLFTSEGYYMSAAKMVINSSGALNASMVSQYDAYLGVRPVISLKSSVKIASGNGTEDSPFIVED